MYTKTCEWCSKTFTIRHRSKLTQRFCSRKCGYRGKSYPPNSGQFKKGMPNHWMRGRKGLQPWHNTSGLWNGQPKGEKNWNWKGGITPLRKKLYFSNEYKSWRQSVFERDDYTCQFCQKRGYKIQADHIKPWAGYPELRFDVDNGRTLCVDCHKTTDTYGVNGKYQEREIANV